MVPKQPVAKGGSRASWWCAASSPSVHQQRFVGSTPDFTGSVPRKVPLELGVLYVELHGGDALPSSETSRMTVQAMDIGAGSVNDSPPCCERSASA